MLKIWGRKNSINVRKVLWCCGELDLAYERVDAGGAFGLTRDPEYLAMNPNGLIPTIDDGGFVLWESNAIVRYLAASYGVGTLWPKDARQRADADRSARRSGRTSWCRSHKRASQQGAGAGTAARGNRGTGSWNEVRGWTRAICRRTRRSQPVDATR